MASNPFSGVTLTLRDFRTWLENEPNLSDNYRRAGLRVFEAYRQSEIKKMKRVYEDGASHNEREQETAERILAALRDRMTEATEQVERGEIGSDELLEVASQVERDMRRMVTESDNALLVEERAWEEVDRDPEDWQVDYQLRRSPALKHRLPRLTEDMFTGRDPLPFD